MEKVSWTEHKTTINNEEVLEMIADERSLMQIIKTRQQKWFRHSGGESWLKTVIKGKMLGESSTKRPRSFATIETSLWNALPSSLRLTLLSGSHSTSLSLLKTYFYSRVLDDGGRI